VRRRQCPHRRRLRRQLHLAGVRQRRARAVRGLRRARGVADGCSPVCKAESAATARRRGRAATTATSWAAAAATRSAASSRQTRLVAADL
jgi:hypothetical protein